MDDPVDGTEPFEVLGDEHRLGILAALAEHLRENPDDPAMGFSALRRAVGMRDSGNFNYHLDRVRGQFVTETEDGYRLSPAGMEVIGAVVSGTFAPGTPNSPEIEESCPICDGDATARYENGQLRVVCENGHEFRNHLPPGAVADRSLPEVVRTMSLKTHRDVEMGVEGVCPTCYGPLEWDVDPETAGDPPEFETRCERCGSGLEVPPVLVAAYHPTVAAFYHDNGVTVRETPPWSPAFWNHTETSVERDPVAVRVAVTFGDDCVRATLDGSLSVVDVERP